MTFKKWAKLSVFKINPCHAENDEWFDFFFFFYICFFSYVHWQHSYSLFALMIENHWIYLTLNIFSILAI